MPSLQFREAHGQRAQVTGRTVKFVISDDNIAVTTMKVTAKMMWMTVMRRILIFRPRAAASGEGLFALNYLLLSVPGTAQHGTAGHHGTTPQGTARHHGTAPHGRAGHGTARHHSRTAEYGRTNKGISVFRGGSLVNSNA